MTSLVLEHDRDDAKTMVKAAFERTRGIKQYHDDGHRIVGKSGMGLASYGEKVTVEIPERQSGEGETMVNVSAEKEVSVNITANPDKYKSRFLSELDMFRDYEVEKVKDVMSETLNSENTKEVRNAGDLRDGSSSMGLVMVVMMIIVVLMTFFMMAAVMP
jgi:hypothetical protein